MPIEHEFSKNIFIKQETNKQKQRKYKNKQTNRRNQKTSCGYGMKC